MLDMSRKQPKPERAPGMFLGSGFRRVVIILPESDFSKGGALVGFGSASPQFPGK
jgi:hypothetical protein